jgi:hypothetical protein
MGLPTQSQHPQSVYDVYTRAHVILTPREVMTLADLVALRTGERSTGVDA